jgi:hypothetical protein
MTLATRTDLHFTLETCHNHVNLNSIRFTFKSLKGVN